MRLTKAEAARIAAQPGYSAVGLDDATEPTPAARPTQLPRSIADVRDLADMFAQGDEPSTEPIRLTLPYPPSANVYWRMAKNRRTGYPMMVKSAAANRYIAAVADICDPLGIKPIKGDVVVSSLRVYRPQRSGDLDNRIKVTLDALEGFAYVDDMQVVELHAYRHDDKDNPRVELEIRELTCT